MMERTLDKNQGNYIDLLKIILTIGIIFRHSIVAETGTGFAAFDVFTKIILFLSELCVPLFFALSGYLFFLNVPEKPQVDYFISKLKKRAVSLVIPYLIANCIAFVIYWAVSRYAPLMLNGFMGENWKNPLFVFWTGPINLSLWFLRDLIVACLCAPILYLLVRFTGFLGIAALGLWSFFHGMTSWANLYFALGAFMSIKRIDIPAEVERIGPYLALLFICSAPLAMRDGKALELSILIGLPLCIYLGNIIMPLFKRGVPIQSRGWCYFVYLYHYLLIIGIKKVLCMLIPQSSGLAMMIIYILTIISVLIVVSVTYYLLRKLSPKFTSILVGGKV